MTKREIAIRFKKVSKKYKRGQKKLLKEALISYLKPGKTEDFWALKDVSFEVNKGETLGIIGPNGSGKSTILKLIAGVTEADRGRIEVNGEVAPLIELGAGLHPELTGRENIFISGSILGLTRKQIKDRFNDIVAFSELEEFIDTPIKHYSTGMFMRLGFSIAVNTNPDILIVDEVLAVGDTAFQKKCINKMKDFKAKGVTILFVSHDLRAVEEFCDMTFLMEESRIVARGRPKDVIIKYHLMVAERAGKL